MDNKNLRLLAYGMIILSFPLLFTSCASNKVSSGETASVVMTAKTDESPAIAETPEKQDQKVFQEHIVQQGESISVIARKYNVSIDSIVSLNNIDNADFIQVGQKLLIPGLPEGEGK